MEKNLNNTIFVHLSDRTTQTYKDAAEWAEIYCKSFIRHKVIDVSDFSYTHSEIAEYEFRDEKDAQWFRLRWETIK